MGFLAVRGSGKTTLQYFAWIRNSYQKGAITYEEYVEMAAMARIALLGDTEEEAFEWAKEMLETKEEQE